MNSQQTIRTAVRVTHLIDELPAIPTQDWVTRCARALSTLSDRIAVISLVCTLNPELDRIVVYSSGVELASWPESESQSAAELFNNKDEIGDLKSERIPDAKL